MSRKKSKKEYDGELAEMMEAMDPGVLASSCLCGHKGCFANHGGLCDILNNTDFEGKSCSFFKTQKQYEADLAKYSSNDRKEEDDFLTQNARLIKELEAMEQEAKKLSDEKPEVTEKDTIVSGDDDGWDSEDDEGGGDDGK